MINETAHVCPSRFFFEEFSYHLVSTILQTNHAFLYVLFHWDEESDISFYFWRMLNPMGSRLWMSQLLSTKADWRPVCKHVDKMIYSYFLNIFSIALCFILIMHIAVFNQEETNLLYLISKISNCQNIW